MLIEEGKSYRTRSGSRADPVEGLVGWFRIDGGVTRFPYAANGEVCTKRDGPNGLDLVAEWGKGTFVKLGGTYFRPEDVKVISSVNSYPNHSKITLYTDEVWTIPMSPRAVAEALNVR